MRGFALAGIMAAALFCAIPDPAAAGSETLVDLLAGRDTPACPRYQQTPRDPCNIVVKRPGGNPGQDMTGSRTWQGTGGPRCKTICRFTGFQY